MPSYVFGLVPFLQASTMSYRTLQSWNGIRLDLYGLVPFLLVEGLDGHSHNNIAMSQQPLGHSIMRKADLSFRGNGMRGCNVAFTVQNECHTGRRKEAFFSTVRAIAESVNRDHSSYIPVGALRDGGTTPVRPVNPRVSIHR
jgi:hypothetical protein